VPQAPTDAPNRTQLDRTRAAVRRARDANRAAARELAILHDLITPVPANQEEYEDLLESLGIGYTERKNHGSVEDRRETA
jgi:hypothetical protein